MNPCSLTSSPFWSCLTLLLFWPSFVIAQVETTLPLQWQFQAIQSTPCTSQLFDCKQAPLKDGSVLMFDGGTRQTWLFQWDNKTNGTTAGKWTVLPSTGKAPSTRVDFAMSSLGEGKVLLFGGKKVHDKHLKKFLGDTWIFDQSTKKWAVIEHPPSTTKAPPARNGHAMASLGEGKVVLFGGLNNMGHLLNDTWIFDLSNKMWAEIEHPPTTKAPPARLFHAMASLGDGKVLLFGGGGNFDKYRFFNDTWIFDQSTKKWAEIKHPPTTKAPPARNGHAMASLGEGKVVLFGGLGGQYFLDDTWIFDRNNKKWAEIEHPPTTKAPPAQAGDAMASLGEGKVVLFGVRSYGDTCDTWVIDRNNNKWTKLKTRPMLESPPARIDHAMASLGDGKVLMFGGYSRSVSGHLLDDTWIRDELNPAGGWTMIDNPPTSETPSARRGHAMASLGEGKVLLFGGLDNMSRLLNDTWIFDLSNKMWAEMDNPPNYTSPPARHGHAMAPHDYGKLVDKVDNQKLEALLPVVALFGGSTVDQFLSDTWIYLYLSNESAGVWIVSTSSNSPPKRAYHAMADLGVGQIIMYGGRDHKQYFGDTWVFEVNIFTWLQNGISGNPASDWFTPSHSDASPPPPRAYHAMATLGTAKCILFGGVGSRQDFGDTWMFSLGHRNGDGYTADWTKLSVELAIDNHMAHRYFHKMAKGLNNSIVLFGGQANYQFGTEKKSLPGNDTWTLLDGCPRGKGQLTSGGCAYCPYGKYKNANTAVECTSCPDQTTTAFIGRKIQQECVRCAGTDTQTKNATCFVDLSSTQFKTVWTCIGTYGPRCAMPCPGGAESPCNNHGRCDSGPNATGKCTCSKGFYGPSCLEQCDCNGGKCNDTATGDGTCTGCNDHFYGPSCNETCECHLVNAANCHDGPTGNGTCTACNHNFYGPMCQAACDCSSQGGTCNDDVSGDGTCSKCYILFKGGGPNCSFPTLGFFLGLFGVALVAVGFWYFQSFRKTKDKLHAVEENYDGLELRHMETTRDNSQLQKAWIVKRADVTLETVIGQGAFGEVWKGQWRGIDVAFKKMFPDEMMDLGHTVINPLILSTPATDNTSSQLNEVALAMLDNLEVGVMMRLRHPRLVAFLGAGEIIDPPVPGDDVPRVGIFVMLEYAAGGDLTHRLQAALDGTKPFPWQDRIQCAMDIAEGMAFIHSEGFIHRDLKSLNVLLDKEGRCMIADLGLATNTQEKNDSSKLNKGIQTEWKKLKSNDSSGSRRSRGSSMAKELLNFVEKTKKELQNKVQKVSQESDEMQPNSVASSGEVKVQEEEEDLSSDHTSKKGTVAWMAPEVLNTNYDKSVDVFSFGVVMWELITGRIPWQGEYDWLQHILMAVVRGERPQATEEELANVPEDYVKLMNRCWAGNPKSRPSFNVILMKLRQIKTGKHVRR